MLTVMSSRARRPRRPLAAVPPPTTPPPGGADTAAGIQALVERLRAGELDAELPVLAAAITERQQLLAAAQALITRASLRVGDMDVLELAEHVPLGMAAAASLRFLRKR